MSKTPETAYKNLGFLNSASARTLRILSEYLEPQSRLQRQKVKDTIVFFGSARFCDSETAGRRVAEANTPDEVRQAKRLQASSRYYECSFAFLASLRMPRASASMLWSFCSAARPG